MYILFTIDHDLHISHTTMSYNRYQYYHCMSIILYTIIFTPTTNRSRGLNPQTGARLPDKGLSRLLNFFPLSRLQHTHSNQVTNHHLIPLSYHSFHHSPVSPTFKQHLGNPIKLNLFKFCVTISKLCLIFSVPMKVFLTEILTL